MVIEKKLIVSNRKKTDLLNELKEKGFDSIKRKENKTW